MENILPSYFIRRSMPPLAFSKEFYLHDSPLYNIAHALFKDQLIITVDLFNYWRLDHKEGIDPDHIIGNFIFKDVKELKLDPQQIIFYDLEILVVNCEQSAGDLDKIEIIGQLDEGNSSYGVGLPPFIISFKAKEVEWIPLETYFD